MAAVLVALFSPFLLSHVLAQCVAPPAGLVSWWRGETNALDYTGTNHGTLAGNAAYDSGRVGHGFVFDGNGAVVQLGNPASLHLQDLTIETWLRRTSSLVVSFNGGPGIGVIFGYDIGGYGLYLDPSGTPALSKIGFNEVKPAVAITDTNWHHVAVTKVGSTVVFYLDGVAYPAAAYDPGFTFSGNAFMGGKGSFYTFYGAVDEVSVYNRPLASNEIQVIYNAGSAGKCVAVASSCAPVPSGLVSWWRGEANPQDQTGTNDGTLAGNTTYGAGRVGQGMVFDGNGAVVQLGNPANLHLQDLTIETWISRASTAVASLNGNGNGVIFGYHIGGYGLYMDPSGTPTLSKIGINEVKPGVTITDTNLHHVAVTKSGSTVVFYVDGVAYPAAAYDPGFTFSENAFIGGLENQYTFYGTVDEVSVYNRALAANEIQAIYNAGSAGKCVAVASSCAPVPSGLVSWWRGEANPQDQTGTNDGTLAGNTTYGAGRVGQGMVFDGNGATVQLGNPASLHFQDLTIETWIRRASAAVTSLNGNGNGHIFGYTGGGYGLYLDPNGTPTLSKVGINEVKPGVMITDTNWHHLAVTKVGSAVVFYVDGVAFPAAAYDPGFTFSQNAFIGGLGNNYTFYGAVDEVSVYNRPLAANEIQAIYNAGSAGKCSIPPVIVSQPTDQTVTAGANVSFNVTASGTTPLSYQWRLNGTNLDGATSAALSLTSVTSGQAGSYSCVVTNVAGSATSSSATLTVNAAPVAPSITTQPISQTVTAGANLSFNVVASGTAPLSYQWRLNGTNLDGATSATLSLTSVTTGQAGSYSCRVTNVAGSATSSSATLTIIADTEVVFATHSNATTYPLAGGLLTVNCAVYHSNQTLLSLLWHPTLPAGFTLTNLVSGDGGPEVQGGDILFVGSLSTNPIRFSYAIVVSPVPPGQTATNMPVGAEIQYQLSGMVNPATVRANPDPLLVSPFNYHAADYRDPRWTIDGSEVNRVLSYWRAGAYHVEPTGLDGYAAGGGNTNGPLHSADYRDARWAIDGSEINRVLSYWRAGGYHVDASGLDGYAPGTNQPGVGGAFAVAQSAGQSPVALQQGPTVYVPGSVLQISTVIEYAEPWLALLVRPQLPEGWTLESVSGPGNPEAVAGEVVWTGAIPPSPIRLVYTTRVPASATGPQGIAGEVEYQSLRTANPARVAAGPAALVLHPFKIDRVARMPDGSVVVSLPEMGSQAFEVQVSSDLETWQTLTPQIRPDGTLRFVDLAAAHYNQRFYRAVLKTGN